MASFAVAAVVCGLILTIFSAALGWALRGIVDGASDEYLTEQEALRKIRLGCMHPEHPDACCALSALTRAGRRCEFEGHKLVVRRGTGE